MKNSKLISSFREISNILDVISMVVRILSVAFVIIQAVTLYRNTRTSSDS